MTCIKDHDDFNATSLKDKVQKGVIGVSILESVIDNVLSRNIISPIDEQHSALITQQHNITHVPYVEAPLSYNDFFGKFMFRNVPCLLGSWATKNWQSRKLWTKEFAGKFVPDFDHLLSSCPSKKVSVSDCKRREFNSQEKSDWKFEDFVKYFIKHSDNNHPSTEPCLYLKDWHYFRDFPNHDVYTTPPYFSSDWLFELWSDSLPPFDDDYRFVYIGPKHSWTPFHADVFHSFSWSANICGRKKWILFPPGCEENLRDQNGRLPYDVTTTSSYTSLPYLEVTQEAGEVMFVPTGWHHQVHNLEDTISINHNWMNGCTVARAWTFLRAELGAVEREIADCRDLMTHDEWTSHCQTVMLSNSGIDFGNFYHILSNISIRRMACVTKGISMTQSDLRGNLRDETIAPRHGSVTQQCGVVLSQLKPLCGRLSRKPPNAELQLILEPLSDLCLLIPILLEMNRACREITMTSQASKCVTLLREICSCLIDVIACFQCHLSRLSAD